MALVYSPEMVAYVAQWLTSYNRLHCLATGRVIGLAWRTR